MCMYVYLCIIVTFIIFNYLHSHCIISTKWLLNVNNKLTYYSQVAKTERYQPYKLMLFPADLCREP